MSDTPITDAALIERRHIHKRDGSVQLLELVDAEIAKKLERERDEALNKAHNYEQGYLTHATRADTLEKERNEAREALRVLFEAAQPALRILQQMEDTNSTDKHEQVSSKLTRYKKDAEVVTDKQEVFRRLVEAIVTTDMTANTLLEVRRLFGDEIDAAVAFLRRTAK